MIPVFAMIGIIVAIGMIDKILVLHNGATSPVDTEIGIITTFAPGDL